MILGHHMGEEAFAAALVSATAVVPVTLLVVRAHVDRIAKGLRRRRRN